MPQRAYPGDVETARVARVKTEMPALRTVARRRRRRDFKSRWFETTVLHVVDSPDAWSAYLRRMTARPGWSVARLARDSGLHRSTIFGWIKEGGGSTTIASVYAIADAFGDTRASALAAAGNVRDEEVEVILAMDWSEAKKVKAIERLNQLRAEEKARRIADIQFMAEADEVDEAS